MDIEQKTRVLQYVNVVLQSDRLPKHDLKPTLLGLFGEVGGILTTAKKLVREKEAYSAFREDAEEELGDTLWYLAAMATRLGFPLVDILRESWNAADVPSQDVHGQLVDLAYAAGKLLEVESSIDMRLRLQLFVSSYLRAMRAMNISFDEVMQRNSKKVSGRFLPLDLALLPKFDDSYDPDERLPEYFEFFIRERKSGQTYLSLNEVFIGDPLTDNMAEPDGYRFHDVFHMANAAVLHWSPVLRALLKKKRKSNKDVDQSEDSGRAIVIEEGLSAWLFSRAKQHNMFEGSSSISFDILKRITEFVQGYEVQACPQALWESAILQGFDVFRRIRNEGSGVVIGSRKTRTISFRSKS